MKKYSVVIFLVFILLGCSSTKITNPSLDKNEYIILKAINYKHTKEYSKALTYYNLALKNDPHNILILKEMGETYSKLEDYPKAIYYYKEALKSSSDDITILRNLSYIYYLSNDYKTSLFYLNKIYDKELDIESKKLKSYLLIKNNNTIEARAYSKNLENDINNFDLVYYKNYINFLNENNFYQDKDLVLNNISSKFYRNLEAMNYYFSIKLTSSDNYLELEKEIKKYIVSEKTNDDLYFTLAEVEFYLKKYHDGILALKFVSDYGKNTNRYKEIFWRLNNEL